MRKKGVSHRRGARSRFFGGNEGLMSVDSGRLRRVKGDAKSKDESWIEINVNDSALNLDNDGAIEKLVDNLSEGQFF